MSSHSTNAAVTATAAEAKSIDVSVLVPVYDNASTLGELIDRLLAVLGALAVSFEIILVDDGSTDASFEILQGRAATDPRLRLFGLTRNFGSQAASCAAADQARGRRVVHIDADLENLPEDIPRLLDLLDQGYDLVCGYREERADPWLTHRLPSALVNAYVRRRTGTDIRDVGCGLRAMDARLIKDLASEGEARRLLAPVLLRRARRVAQAPVRHRSKGSRSAHTFLWLLGIAADYYMLTAARPFLISGLVFAAMLPVGLGMLAFGPHLAGLIVASTGALGALLSLVGEYSQRLYHLSQDTPFYQLKTPDDDESTSQTREAP